jgi:hypothetical protein
MELFRLILCCLPILCSGAFLNFLQNPEVFSREQVVYSSGLIDDWNQKHPSLTSDVVIFNFGNPGNLLEEFRRAIPPQNPVTIIETKQCNRNKANRQAAFVIIVVSTTSFSAVRILLNVL